MAVEIICFSQEGCMGCEEQASINQEVTDLLHVRIEEIDAVKNPEYIKQYNLRVTPTIIILEDGKEKERFQGVIHKEELEKTVKKYL
jgi:thioredoxin 1